MQLAYRSCLTVFTVPAVCTYLGHGARATRSKLVVLIYKGLQGCSTNLGWNSSQFMLNTHTLTKRDVHLRHCTYWSVLNKCIQLVSFEAGIYISLINAMTCRGVPSDAFSCLLFDTPDQQRYCPCNECVGFLASESFRFRIFRFSEICHRFGLWESQYGGIISVYLHYCLFVSGYGLFSCILHLIFCFKVLW